MKTKLKNKIYEKGYNLNTFSEKAGISRFTLHKYFKNINKSLRGDTIYLIAQTLGISYNDTLSLIESDAK